MANTTNVCSVQSRNGGRGNAPLPGVSRTPEKQTINMDETKVAQGAPRKAERDPRASDHILSQRLRRNLQGEFDRLYDDAMREYQRINQQYPGINVSGLIQLTMQLARVEGALYHEDLLEAIQEGGSDEDETDDSELSD